MLRNRLKNISVGEKLGLLSGCLLFAVFAVWVTGYRSVLNMNTHLETLQLNASAVQHRTLAALIHEEALSLPYRALIAAETKSIEEKQAVLAHLQKLTTHLDAYVGVAPTLPLQRDILEALVPLEPEVEGYVRNAGTIVHLALNGQRQEALTRLPDLLSAFAKLEGRLQSLQTLLQKETEQTENQGVTLIKSARFTPIVTLLLAMLIASLFSWHIARAITTPLAEMAEVASRLAQGNINQQILHHSGDEIGILATAFRDLIAYIRNLADVATRISQGDLQVQVLPSSPHDVLSLSFVEMIEDLRSMNTRMQQGARTLASSIDQIVGIMQQVSASTTETASSVSQTAAIVEQVKQTVSVASQNAQQVSNNSQRTVQVSQAGERAVEEALVGMKHVHDQMEAIARSVMQLGEQSQAIGQIITTVNDLTERSNLLAINAAIEAAKAGQAGKGFSVVAQEVKSLADQSKRATAQVHTILNDIRKAAQTTALVTEQGTHSAERGATQAAQAGESIRALSTSIMEAAQAVAKIAASSHQQLVGMDQVATAMNSIKLASTHNANGMKQIEAAIRDVHSVGQTLKELVDQYQLIALENGTRP